MIDNVICFSSTNTMADNFTCLPMMASLTFVPGRLPHLWAMSMADCLIYIPSGLPHLCS